MNGSTAPWVLAAGLFLIFVSVFVLALCGAASWADDEAGEEGR